MPGDNLSYVNPVSRGKTVDVDKSGKYQTITAGIAAALLLSPVPSVTNPVTVLVSPGIYTENITMQPYVNVISLGRSKATTISAAVTTAAVVTMANNCRIEGFTITGATGVGGKGIYFTGVINNSEVNFCDIYNCVDGVYSTGATTVALCRHVSCVGVGTGLTSAFHASGDSEMDLENCTAIKGSGGTLTNAFIAEATGTNMNVNGIQISGAAVGIWSADAADIRISSGDCRDCTTALYASNAGAGVSYLKTIALRISGSVTYDIQTASAAVEIKHMGTFDNSKMSQFAGSTIYLSAWCDELGGQGFKVNGELSVGRPLNGYETHLGEGHATVNGMAVFSFNGAATWVDNTAAAKSIGTTFDGFQAKTAGNIMYIGGDHKFPGIKSIVSTAMAGGSVIEEYYATRTVLGHGAVTNSPFTINATVLGVTSKAQGFIEAVAGDNLSITIYLISGTFVNGEVIYQVTTAAHPSTRPTATLNAVPTTATLWSPLPGMTTAAMTSYGDSVFARIATEDTRFAQVRTSLYWSATAINGVTKYWVRYRIATDITTIPVFDQIKLHTNRTKINSDGTCEFFGSARQYRDIPVQLLSHPSFSPSDLNITYSTNVAVVRKDNQFNNNIKDALAGVFQIPFWCDTSTRQRMRIWWYAPTGGNGNVEFVGIACLVRQGLVIGALTEFPFGVLTAAVNTPAGDRQIMVSEMIGFFSQALPGDKIAFVLSRNAFDGTAAVNAYDTFAQNIVVEEVKIDAHYWRI